MSTHARLTDDIARASRLLDHKVRAAVESLACYLSRKLTVCLLVWINSSIDGQGALR